MAFEVEPAVEGAGAADELAEGFAVFVDHPDVGGDVAHAAFGFEDADALFDEGQIHVEVAALGAGVERGAVGVFRFDEVGGGVVLGAAEVLELDVGRIADDAVEAAVGEDFGEGGVPVEGVDALAFVGIGGDEEALVALIIEGVEVGADEAVSAADVVVERAERFSGRGGVEPEGELGDFHGLLVDVHAVDVVGEDGADDGVLIENLADTGDAFRFGNDPAVFLDEAVERLDEEGTGAAGGIDNADEPELEAVFFQEQNPCSGVGCGAALVVEKRTIFGQQGVIDGRQAFEAELVFDFVQPCAKRLLHNHAHDPLGRVIDAVGFAFAEFVDGEAAIGLGLHDFEFGDRLLEDAAERVERDGAFAGCGAESEVVGGGEVEEGALVFQQARGLAGGAENFRGDVEGIEGGILLEEAAVEFVDGMGAEVSAVAHGAEEGAHFIPRTGAFGIVETALAFFDEDVAKQSGRVAEDAAHVLAEEDENAAVEEALGEADELAARAGEVGVGFNERVIDEFPVVAVFAVEVFFDGFLADDLIAQKAVEMWCAALGEQHVRLEEPPEGEAAEGGGRCVREQGWFGGGGGTADDEALELPAPEAAGVEAEFVHVRDKREERFGECVAVARLPGGLEVVEALLDGRAGVAFAGLFGIEAGADVLELAEHLRGAVAAEVAEGEVGEAHAAGLARAGKFVLRAASEGGGFVTLQVIAPGFDEEALDEGGLGGAFGKKITGGPCAEAGEEGVGCGAGFEGVEFGAPLGAEEGVFEERLGGHEAALA